MLLFFSLAVSPIQIIPNLDPIIFGPIAKPILPLYSPSTIIFLNDVSCIVFAEIKFAVIDVYRHYQCLQVKSRYLQFIAWENPLKTEILQPQKGGQCLLD